MFVSKVIFLKLPHRLCTREKTYTLSFCIHWYIVILPCKAQQFLADKVLAEVNLPYDPGTQVNDNTMGLSPRALEVSQWVLAFGISTTSLKMKKMLRVWFTHTFLSNWANLKLYSSTGLVSNNREQFQRAIKFFLPNFIICKVDNLLFIMYLFTITTGDLFLSFRNTCICCPVYYILWDTEHPANPGVPTPLLHPEATKHGNRASVVKKKSLTR